MNRALQKYVEAATGLTELTRKRAEAVVKNLVKQGEVAADNREKAIEDLLQRVERNRKVVMSLVKAETERAVKALGVARKSDLERLEAKVARLESTVTAGGPATTSGPTKRTAKKSSAAKKASATKKTSASKTARARKTTPSSPGGSSA